MFGPCINSNLDDWFRLGDPLRALFMKHLADWKLSGFTPTLSGALQKEFRFTFSSSPSLYSLIMISSTQPTPHHHQTLNCNQSNC